MTAASLVIGATRWFLEASVLSVSAVATSMCAIHSAATCRLVAVSSVSTMQLAIIAKGVRIGTTVMPSTSRTANLATVTSSVRRHAITSLELVNADRMSLATPVTDAHPVPLGLRVAAAVSFVPAVLHPWAQIVTPSLVSVVAVLVSQGVAVTSVRQATGITGQVDVNDVLA